MLGTDGEAEASISGAEAIPRRKGSILLASRGAQGTDENSGKKSFESSAGQNEGC